MPLQWEVPFPLVPSAADSETLPLKSNTVVLGSPIPAAASAVSSNVCTFAAEILRVWNCAGSNVSHPSALRYLVQHVYAKPSLVPRAFCL